MATVTPPVDRFASRLAAVAVVAAAAPLYAPVVAGLVRQWYEDGDATYGFVVAVAAGVAAWQRRARLHNLPLRGSSFGAVALIGAAAVYITGTLAADVFLLRMSGVAFLAAALWFVCGGSYVRALAPALTLCAAAIPLPAAVITQLTLPLQLIASQLAAGTLGVLGIEVAREGNVLTLSTMTLQVAEACSGMRSLVTLGALVLVHWAISGTKLARAAILLAAIVPVALAGNGLRIAATAILALRIGEDATRGFIHDATGFVAFMTMGAALVAVHVLTVPRRRVRSPKELRHHEVMV